MMSKEFSWEFFKDEACVRKLLEAATGEREEIYDFKTCHAIKLAENYREIVYDLYIETLQNVYVFDFNNDKERDDPVLHNQYFSVAFLNLAKDIDDIDNMKTVHVVFVHGFGNEKYNMPIMKCSLRCQECPEINLGMETINIYTKTPSTGLLADFSQDINMTCSEDMRILEFKNRMQDMEKSNKN